MSKVTCYLFAFCMVASCTQTDIFSNDRKILTPKLVPYTVPIVANDKLLETAKLKLDQEDYVSALRYFEQAMQQQPDNAEAILGYATSADLTGHFETSKQTYEQYRKKFGADFAYHNNLGFSYILQAKYKLARTHILEAIALAPESRTARNNFKLLEKVSS